MIATNMQPGDIYVGPWGSEVLMPPGERQLTEIKNEITRYKRMADGTYKENVVRTYTDYQSDWDLMIGPDYDSITAIEDIGQLCNLMLMKRDGTIVQQTVKVHKTQGQRISIEGNWLWQNVSLLLECV